MKKVFFGLLVAAVAVGGSAFINVQKVEANSKLITRILAYNATTDKYELVTYNPNSCVEGLQQCAYSTTNDAVPSPLPRTSVPTYISSLTTVGPNHAQYSF